MPAADAAPHDADSFHGDVGYIAITPTVRRGYGRLGNGRQVVAFGDAHIVMDPITGQGANKAAEAATTLAEAIRVASVFDESFCADVEHAAVGRGRPAPGAGGL